VFPIYDWVRNVVGDNERIEVKLLVSDGADLHSFQPTAKDAIAIKSAELLVRVGGVDDSFVDELAKDRGGLDLRLMEAEGVTLRDSAHNSDHGHGDGHDHPTDEHIWLSVRNAAACVEAIRKALAEIDPEGAELYEKNAAEYKAKLTALDLRFKETLSAIESPRMVVADRFPFVYLTADYGIEYEAAFEGCTTDAEAGFDTVLRLANKLEEWQLSHIFVTEASDGRLASSVCENVNCRQIKVTVLDSMQSVSAKDIELGVSYIGIMENDLAVLSAAFSK
jgi:zinc transport system substrate-binding protein